MHAAERRASGTGGISVVPNGVAAVSADQMQLDLPDGRVILSDMNLSVGARRTSSDHRADGRRQEHALPSAGGHLVLRRG